MAALILRRLALAIPILFGILTLNFFLIHAAPGNPIDLMLAENADAESRALLIEAWGLDEPVWMQYLSYLERVVLHFDFGESIRSQRPVSDIILSALPNTLQLSIVALSIQLAGGIALGVISAVRSGSRWDQVLRIGTLTLYSIPSFYLGIVLLFVFAGGVFSVLPTSGMVDILRHDSMGFFEKSLDRFMHMLLPALTLGLGSAASVSRYMRGEMLDVLHQDYIRTARAKGLSESRVILKHALRNALLPIITLIGLSLPFLFGGSVIVENVFGWPGLGREAVDAAFGQDYPVFLAINLILAAMVLLGNLLSDLLYALVDPRLRTSTK